jgi:hypothetical protein
MSTYKVPLNVRYINGVYAFGGYRQDEATAFYTNDGLVEVYDKSERVTLDFSFQISNSSIFRITVIWGAYIESYEAPFSIYDTPRDVLNINFHSYIINFYQDRIFESVIVAGQEVVKFPRLTL